MTDTHAEYTEGLLRIGEVARLFNLSVGTLRHYEQMGLLEPAYVDAASGYRYYGARQLSTLNTISHLRVLNLPLAQIREFVTTRDVDLMQRQLAQQQKLIERKRRELERVSRKIDDRLALLRGALDAELDTIYEVNAPELRCAVLRERVNPRCLCAGVADSPAAKRTARDLRLPWQSGCGHRARAHCHR